MLLAFGFGPMEMMIIGGIALLLFGHRLPGAMRSLGRGILEFKKGVEGADEESDSTAQVEQSKKESQASS